MSKFLRFLLPVLFTLFLLTALRPMLAQENCTLATRLVPGVEGRVLPDSANRLRNAPSVNSPLLMNIPVGDRFQILDGPSCVDGYWWWQVDYNGSVGWTAEGEGTTYWVEPMLLPELEPLTTDNLTQIEPLAVIGTDPINQLAWSPDNQVILAAGSSGLWRFDLSKPDQPRLIQGYDGFFRSVAYSPDGKTFATGNTLGQTILWDAKTLKPLQTIQVSEFAVEALAYPSSGEFVASGSFDGIVQLWHIARQAEMTRWQIELRQITSLDFSPDNLQLAVGALMFQNWMINLQTNEMVALNDTTLTNSVDFSPDGRFLVTGQLGGRSNSGPVNVPIQIWDVHTGELFAEIDTHTRDVFNIVFETQDSLLVNDGTFVKRWSIASLLSSSPDKVVHLEPDNFDITEIVDGSLYSYASLSPDTHTLAFLNDATLKVVDLNSNTVLEQMSIPYFLNRMDGLFSEYQLESDIFAMALHPDKPQLAFGKGTNTILWNYDTGIPERKLMGHNADITNLVFSHDGKLLAAGTNTHSYDYGPDGPSEIRIWNTTTWDLFRYLPDTWSNPRSLRFNLTNELLTPARLWDGTSQAIDIQTERPAILQLGLQPQEMLVWMTFHPTDPDITLVSVVIKPEVEEAATLYRTFIWDQRRQTRTELLEQKEAPWRASFFSADGTSILIAYGEGTYLANVKWSIWKNYQRILESEGEGIGPYALNSDGSLVAFQQGDQIVVWDVEQRIELSRLPRESQYIELPLFSNDGKWMILDRNVWNLASQEHSHLRSPAELNPNNPLDYISDAKLTADNTMLILNNGGSLEMWGVLATN